MLIASFLVLGGLLLLLAGGEILLRGAVGIALIARITPAVVGLTVVAAGTSVPELAVSILASLKNQTDIAVGNVVGSNIFNIAVILGLSAFVRPLRVRGDTIKLEYPVLALVTLMFVAVAQHGVINRLDGLLFLSAYVAFIIYVVSLVRAQLNSVEKTALADEVEELTDTTQQQLSFARALLYVGGGSALLGGGAHLTVTGAVELGKIFGLSDTVIGLTIIAGGTGLPEVVTSLVSTYRGRDDVAVANVIGSNLFNILVILGLSAIVVPLQVPTTIIRSDNWWLLGITLGLFPILWTGLTITRREAAVLCLTYLLYLSLLLRQVGG